MLVTAPDSLALGKSLLLKRAEMVAFEEWLFCQRVSWELDAVLLVYADADHAARVVFTPDELEQAGEDRTALLILSDRVREALRMVG